MKNVNGLENAMRLVESACEKGEITIIGEGEIPSPQELLVKCAEFVEKQYGASVKMLAIVDNHAVSYDSAYSATGSDCEDEDTEDEDDLDEEATEVGKFDTDGIYDYLDGMLHDRLDQIAKRQIDEAIKEIVEYYEGLDGKPTEELDVEDVSGDIYNILEVSSSLKDDLAEEIADDIEDYVLSHFYEIVEE